MSSCRYVFYANENRGFRELGLSSDVSDIDGIPRLTIETQLLNYGMNHGIISSTVTTGKL